MTHTLLRRRPTIATDTRRVRDYARALYRGDAGPPLVIFADADGVWAVGWATFRRELTRVSQLEGIARVKLNGVYTGRARSIDSAKVRELWDSGLRASDIAATLGIGRSSVYRVLEGSRQ